MMIEYTCGGCGIPYGTDSSNSALTRSTCPRCNPTCTANVPLVIQSKARQVIPNWPRGRSATRPYPEHFAYGLKSFGFGRDSAYDIAMFEDQLDSDRRYHEGQARMMEDWHRTGSMATSALNQEILCGNMKIIVRPRHMRKIVGVE